ncbi:MAG: CvpA family protein [Oscillospiraceae bacterium]|nr:CvpA family protein [Oscillospiraceae bacterium]
MKTVIDIVLIAIVAICVWTGYKKGLIMGIGGILAIVIAIYGGNLLANVFSYDLEPTLRPFLNGYVEGVVSDEGSGVRTLLGWDRYEYSMDDLLSQHPDRQAEFCRICYEAMGFDTATSESMAQRAVTYAHESGGSVTGAMKHILSQSVSYVSIFIVAALLVLIVLTALGNLPNLSYKIPNLDMVNDIGGAVAGLFTGFLFCVLLVWALKFMGMLLGSALQESWIGGWLLRENYLLPYLGI